jgi:hypothetical protein
MSTSSEMRAEAQVKLRSEAQNRLLIDYARVQHESEVWKTKYMYVVGAMTALLVVSVVVGVYAAYKAPPVKLCASNFKECVIKSRG